MLWPCGRFHQPYLLSEESDFQHFMRKWAAIHLNCLKYCTSPRVLDLSGTTRREMKHFQCSVRTRYMYSAFILQRYGVARQVEDVFNSMPYLRLFIGLEY